MLKVITAIGALLGFGFAALGFVTYRSDIQLIFGAVGLFSGLVLLGITFVLARLDKTWDFLMDIDEQIRGKSD